MPGGNAQRYQGYMCHPGGDLKFSHHLFPTLVLVNYDVLEYVRGERQPTYTGLGSWYLEDASEYLLE